MFYVYRLIDPRDSACFYIGKGKGQRAWQHQKEAAQGTITCNRAKQNRIVAILAAGMDVEIDIVARFDDERTAYAHEYDLIQTTRGLTNIVGVGSSRAQWPPPSPEEMLKARRMAKRQQLEKLRETQYKRFVSGLPDHLQATAAEWLKSLRDQLREPESLTPALPSHVACPVWRHRRPPDAPAPKRNNTRKGRRKYKKSAQRKFEVGPITGLPPNLRA